MSTYNYINLPLYTDYFYSYTVSLENNTYELEFVYNQYGKKWYMSVYTEDRVPVVLGLALLPEYPIAIDYILPNLSGFFWLYPVAELYTNKYLEEPEAISQYYSLKYAYDFT